MTVSVRVSLGDVKNRYEGNLNDRFTDTFIETKIADTVDKANAKWGARIQSRLDSGVLTNNLYKATIAEAVLRVLRNPEGFYQETEGSYSYGKRADVASGYLMFTAANVEDLAGGNRVSYKGTARVPLQRGW